MPTVDALGLLAQGQQENLKAQDLAQAKADVVEQTSKVESTVKQLGDAQLAKDLAVLKDIQPPTAADTKRQAIQKLGDISDRIKQLEKQKNLDQAAALKDLLQEVKTGPFKNDQAQKIAQAIAKGDFNKAAELAKEAQKLAKDGKRRRRKNRPWPNNSRTSASRSTSWQETSSFRMSFRRPG